MPAVESLPSVSHCRFGRPTNPAQGGRPADSDPESVEEESEYESDGDVTINVRVPRQEKVGAAYSANLHVRMALPPHLTVPCPMQFE